MRLNEGGIHLSLAVVFALLCGSGEVRAANNPTSCDNNIDRVATPECGGDVCTYSAKKSPACTPAGTGANGQDGWYTSGTDCRCYAQGARCEGVFSAPSRGFGLRRPTVESALPDGAAPAAMGARWATPALVASAAVRRGRADHRQMAAPAVPTPEVPALASEVPSPARGERMGLGCF
jgi:hypothetical protein